MIVITVSREGISLVFLITFEMMMGRVITANSAAWDRLPYQGSDGYAMK